MGLPGRDHRQRQDGDEKPEFRASQHGRVTLARPKNHSTRRWGIDGIIKEDRLGLDVVYVQAKKWTNTIGRPEIQKFAGALQGQRARKGVFITTSTFSADARAFVSNIESKIVLIDGQQLAQFMFEHNVGVAPASTYEVKKLDADFFDEE